MARAYGVGRGPETAPNRRSEGAEYLSGKQEVAMYIESWMAVLAAVMGGASVACVVATARLDRAELVDSTPKKPFID
jgi:hypothetical protein